MSRGHGKFQRWLLAEGLSEEPRTLREIGHLWVCHIEGQPCTHEDACCEDPQWQATRSEREALRRAIKRLAAEGGYEVVAPQGGRVRTLVVDWDYLVGACACCEE